MPARPEAGDEEMEGILYLLQEFKGKVVLFGISDVVDIAIMAFLIYKVIMLMRRTNSGAVAKGVLLLLFALGVSTFFHLNTVSYLLQQLMVWGVVALVVIFQPEIRRFLEQMGRTSLGKVFTPEEARNELDSAITQTVDAYMSLSKSKTGALMVFERKNMLDDAIKTGTALDCTVNAELLKNIFWNKAPLHDGAVIVRAGRIVGAGCMLPMSGNVNLSQELGMRHRAGIGASEHTDAVVAIVSEETGSISVAVGGMLKRHLAPETLERLLRNELLPERENDEAASKFKLGNLLRFGKGKKQDGNENS
jgi:diadenylate cyclase